MSSPLPWLSHIPAHLREMLNGAAPDTIVFSDMSGTLLHQRRDGFPPEQRLALRRYLDRAGTLVLITGDSFVTTREVLVEPLVPRPGDRLYLVTGGGYAIHAAGEGSLQLVAVSRELESRARAELLAEIERMIRQSDPAFMIHSPQRERLLSAGGERVDITGQLNTIDERFLLEVRPNKLTLYFPDHPESEGEAAAIMGACARDATINRLAATHGAYIIANNNSLDIILQRKEDGIDLWRTTFPALAHEMEGRHVVVMGDARNDLGLLSYPFRAKNVLRAFLGRDDRCFEELKALTPKEGEPALYLRGAFTEGARDILELLAGTGGMRSPQ